MRACYDLVMNDTTGLRRRYAALIALGSVHGIGPVHARELVAKGITSIPELRAAVAAGTFVLL